MGRLYYGSTAEPIVMDDRELAHFRVVATTKLRRSESFSASFTSEETGRSTLWMHCSIPLRFEFDTAEPFRLDAGHVNDLAQAASSAMGVVIDLDEASRGSKRELAAVA